MPTETPHDLPAPAPDEPTPETDRYAALEVGIGEVMIYDREDHGAWITSDSALALAAMA